MSFWLDNMKLYLVGSHNRNKMLTKYLDELFIFPHRKKILLSKRNCYPINWFTKSSCRGIFIEKILQRLSTLSDLYWLWSSMKIPLLNTFTILHSYWSNLTLSPTLLKLIWKLSWCSSKLAGDDTLICNAWCYLSDMCIVNKSWKINNVKLV